MDCSPSGSPVHGILQARILEWVAIPFSKGSSQPRDPAQVSCIAGEFFTTKPPGKPLGTCTLIYLKWVTNKDLEYSSGNPAQCMWLPGWEGSLGENGYMYMNGWVPSLFPWNYQNIVNGYTPIWAFQTAPVLENLPANAEDIRDVGLIVGWEDPLGGGHSNPLQYSCLENSMDRGAWWATVHRVAKSQTWLQWLSVYAYPNLKFFFKK